MCQGADTSEIIEVKVKVKMSGPGFTVHLTNQPFPANVKTKVMTQILIKILTVNIYSKIDN